MLALDEVLASPSFRRAQVHAGAEAVAGREVSWVSVIHWPAMEFVRPGELVLTTGVGCDADGFARFVAGVADAGAAALVATLPSGGDLREIPAAARALAAERQMPLIELPWEVAFAEVSRWVVDELIGRRYGPQPESGGELHARFTEILLTSQGIDGVAATLETVLQRPALIFDARFTLLGNGPAARSAFTGRGVDEVVARARGLGEEERARLAELLAFGGPQRVRLPELGLGGGVGIVVAAGRRMLGYVVVLDDVRGAAPSVLPSYENRALEHAATAAALELLRLRAGRDGGALERDDLVWTALTGGSTAAALVRRAALLGVDVGTPWGVALADLRGQPQLPDDVPRQRASDAGAWLVVDEPGARAALLVPERGGRGVREVLDELRERVPETARVPWGVARAARPFEQLDASLPECERALFVGRAMLAPGAVADPREIGPLMMLGGLAGDRLALSFAHDVLDPVVAYDRDTARNLLETLDVYLQEACNASSTARRLHLNRHSLLYRLRKLEDLTGRELASSSDRFLLDMALRVLRFAEPGVVAPGSAALAAPAAEEGGTT